MSQPSIVFDRAAGYYDETRGFPPGEEQHVAAVIVRAGALTAASRLLEVGIGTGRIALPLAPHVHSIAGIDLSRPMLERLRAKQQNEPVAVAEGDATRLPFASGSFDAALGVHIFHLIPNWQAALDEVARVLRPGGVLLSGYRNHDVGGDDPYRWLWNIWSAEVGSENPHVGVQRGQFSSFLEDSDWLPVAEPLIHTFPEYHTLREFLDRLDRRVWSNLWRIPDDLYARGLAAVHAAVAERQANLDERIPRESNFTVRAYTPPR